MIPNPDLHNWEIRVESRDNTIEWCKVCGCIKFNGEVIQHNRYKELK